MNPAAIHRNRFIHFVSDPVAQAKQDAHREYVRRYNELIYAHYTQRAER